MVLALVVALAAPEVEVAQLVPERCLNLVEGSVELPEVVWESDSVRLLLVVVAVELAIGSEQAQVKNKDQVSRSSLCLAYLEVGA